MFSRQKIEVFCVFNTEMRLEGPFPADFDSNRLFLNLFIISSIIILRFLVVSCDDIPVNIAAAFDALRRNDLVFGPSDDGGYWLVGAAQGARVGALFENVRWSTEHALVDTLENIRSGLRVEILQMLADIDDGAAYYARRQSRRI